MADIRFAFHRGVEANTTGETMDLSGVALVDIQVEGITTATITPKCTVDGSTYYAVQGFNLQTGALVTAITADGLYRFPAAGDLMQCPISGYGAGTITVIGSGKSVASGINTADVDIAGAESVALVTPNGDSAMDDTLDAVKTAIQNTPTVDLSATLGNATKLSPTGGSKTVTTAGTAEALVGTSTLVSMVYIRAQNANTNPVFIGDSNVDKTSSHQTRLATANDWVSIEAPSGFKIDLNEIYVDATTNGEGVDYVYWS